ncbi:HNH endonuclease [Nocardioides marmoriginsengisoli]|uniref:HNH endonuclease n=1 Tax=Nocardioides marmoriginsengisoli TaxID=661483 RepID=A0A3N0CB77_9ACTN|nr:HNH endonuclease signature motif containing protein [Nocardioides marmoriginsengisoli]RNL60569.1 HNH endonuclease [Nocardioides marmoriginsengisoli]
MTTTAEHLDPAPAPDLQACLDTITAIDTDALDPDGQARLVQSLSQVVAVATAKKLQALASAERSRTAARVGAASTGQWAARLTNSDQVVAQRQVRLARGLDDRPAAGAALARGVISPEHAEVIVHADRQLPAHVTTAQREVVEQELVTKAQVLSPSALRRVARRALTAIEDDVAAVDAHENELVRDLEQHARTRTRLTLHDNDDGTVTGHFTVPTAQGHLLRKILDTITAPRRGRPGASRAQVGDREARTDWDRARGEAFCELVDHLPTDHLHPRTAATLVVTVDEATLRHALKVAHLDTDEALSAGEARRLACTARILPVVLGGASLPLDLGRSARLFSEAQRTALGTTHRACAADGCERPFAWCELHHDVPWSHLGKTDLARAVPLCHFHHRRIHDQHYVHHRQPDGSIAFHQRHEPPLAQRARNVVVPSV